MTDKIKEAVLKSNMPDGVYETYSDRETGWFMKAMHEYASLVADAAREDEAVDFLDSIRDYEKESGNKVCYDERTSSEFYQLYLKHKNEKK